MASVFLDSNDTFTVSNNNVRVFGAATGTEVVTVGAGVTGVVLDQSVERVALGAAPGAYTYQQQGINLVVYSGTTVVTTVPLQAGANGTALTFTTGTVKAVVSATGMTLGGTAVTAGTTAAAATLVAPTVIDNTVTSTPVVTTPTLPTLSVASASLAEGNTGTANMTFTVSLSAASSSAVTVAYATTAGTATSSVDFTAASGTLTIAAGSTSGTVTVPVLGDTVYEPNETLTLTLSSPTNATVSTTAGSATGTITNDDTNALPVIAVPATPGSAFIGISSAISGITFTDADDNAGFTVTLQAAGSSQLSFTTLTGVSAVNAAGTAVAGGIPSNLITVSGTKADLNTALTTLKYATNSTTPTTESVSITVTDPNGGRTTGSLALNIGSNLTLTSNADSLTGSAGDDQFGLTSLFSDFGTTDTLIGGTGTDKLTVTLVSGALPTLTTAATGIEILDLTTPSTGGGNVAASVDGDKFSNALTTIYYSAGTTSTDDLTVTNFAEAQTIGVKTTMDVLSATLKTATGSTDSVTVNLRGGITVATVKDSADEMEILSIVSSNDNVASTSTNTISNIADSSFETVNVSGATALTITSVNTDLTKLNASSLTAKLTVTGTDATAAVSVTGGTAGDSITFASSNSLANTILGGAGNDTISGGVGAESITGGTGSDSLTGGITGLNSFYFAPGDSGNTSTTRDTITDLKTGDKIYFSGYGVTALTDATAIGTSATSATTKEIYVSAVNSTNAKIIIETAADGSSFEEIYIPAAYAGATFTYNTAGTDSISDDWVSVGTAPLVKTNSGQGTLTLTGNTIAAVTVGITTDGDPTVGGANSPVLGGIVRTLVASNVTGAGVNVTGSTGNDTLTLTPQADTVLAGGGNDRITLTETGTQFTDVVKFGAASSDVGSDTIIGFALGSSSAGYDILQFNTSGGFASGGFVSSAGWAGNIASATAASNSVITGDNKLFAIQTASGSGSLIDESSEIAALFMTNSASGGVVASLAASAKSILVSGALGSTSVNVWYIDNATTLAVAATEVKLVGSITLASGDISGFDISNFSLIA